MLCILQEAFSLWKHGGKMKRKIHVIPHTHWDKEWYFTVSRSSVYFMKDMQDILNVLETQEAFSYFLLDGQVSLINEYLKWKPEDFKRIKKLVEDERLILGPWYTQSDLMLASGESLLRNLFYGMRDSEQYGKSMKVAYVPDSFGQAGNMPQIYRDFDLNSTVFWRGVSDEMVEKINFTWIGDDGSSVFATQLPNGYYTAFNIPEEKEASKIFWEEVCIPSEAKRSATKNVYIANGFDQAPIRQNLPELIQRRNLEDSENEYCISTIENYIRDTLTDLKKDQVALETVHGELLSAKHMRVHKTIYSSRADLKKLNTEVQNYMTHILEPMMALSYSMGNEYPVKTIEEVWKLLLDNAAHDSMGSCICDSANEDVYMRYKRAKEIAAALVELHCRMIAQQVQGANHEVYTLTLFNTATHMYHGTVHVHTYIPKDNFLLKDDEDQIIPYTILHKKDVSEYVKEQCIQMNPSQEVMMPDTIYEADLEVYIEKIPAFGYLQLTLSFEASSKQELTPSNCLENEFYQIYINENGSLNILDKSNHHMYYNQAVITDSGEDGDSFNYSPPRNDYVVSSMDAKAEYEIQSSQVIDRAMIRYTLSVPYNLEERAEGLCTQELPIELEVTLKKGRKVIEFSVTIDNKVLSHKMCIHFDTAIKSTFNYADQQFGTIQRPNQYEQEIKSYQECLQTSPQKNATNVINWDNDPNVWQEPMIPIEPLQSFVSLNDGKRGVAVFPQAVREYEITGTEDDTISITLFRTYGVMGRENLLYRPGRSSGERTMTTPDAQLLKKMSFTLGLYYYDTDFNEANIASHARDFNTPIISYGYGGFLNGRILFAQEQVDGMLPSSSSLLESHGGLTLSTIKKWEYGDGLIIRFFNGAYQKELNERICFHLPLKEAYVVNAREEKQYQLPIKDDCIELEAITHCKYVSILVQLEK